MLNAQKSKTSKNTELKIQSILMKGRAFIALIIVTIIFVLIVPNFLNKTNLVVMTKHVAIYGILAIGMTFVILTGGIDLSVGSVAGLCAMMAGGFINYGIAIGSNTLYPSIPMVIILTLIIGTLCGTLNGIIIAKFNVAAFIATLGMWYIARGFAQIRSNGLTFPNLVGREELGNTGFPLLGAGSFLGISTGSGPPEEAALPDGREHGDADDDRDQKEGGPTPRMDAGARGDGFGGSPGRSRRR